jgi:hypothetical protein
MERRQAAKGDSSEPGRLTLSAANLLTAIREGRTRAGRVIAATMTAVGTSRIESHAASRPRLVMVSSRLGHMGMGRMYRDRAQARNPTNIGLPQPTIIDVSYACRAIMLPESGLGLPGSRFPR